ncbi:Prepilin-type N-terminal cleavage/methylation domain-containing protein [Candidatus Electronema halotolerans]
MKMNKLRMLASDKGFTLIELMIVIAIIGILAAVAIPNFIAYRDKAYCSAAEKDANSIAGAVSEYFAIPSHTTWVDQSLAAGYSGGAQASVNFSALSGQNSASVVGPVSSIVITVTDGSGRCPKDYMTAQTAAGWNSTDRTFTKAME